MAPKYNTWAITIRPTNGITNEQIECVTNWIVKSCDYYHIVTEKDGWERHLHAALFLKRDDHKSNLNNRILSIPCLKDTLTGAEQVVMRKGTKIMYDWNWINKYMNPKENLKRDPFHKDIDSFLPPVEQWEVIRDQRFPEKGDKRAEQKFEGDPWMLKMEGLFKDYLNGARNEPGQLPPPLSDAELEELQEKKASGIWLSDEAFIRKVELEKRDSASRATPPAKERYEGGYEQWIKDNSGEVTVIMDVNAERLITEFYHTMMYDWRCVKVERDPKRVKNGVVAMLRFFTKYTGDSHCRGLVYEGALTKKEQEELDRLNDVS